MSQPIPVVEMYLGVGQDGALLGHPTVFVEIGGCGYRCRWCSSLHAVLPEYETTWDDMTAEEILMEAEDLAGGPCLVTLTGGDPARHDLEDLILLGQNQGFRFAVETQGAEDPAWLDYLDYLIVSPKPPSSGMSTDFKQLHHVIGAGLAGKPKLSIKVSVLDEADFSYAEMIHELFPPVDFYISPVNATPPKADGSGVFDYGALVDRIEWIANKVMERRLPDMRVTLPINTLIWGNERA